MGMIHATLQMHGDSFLQEKSILEQELTADMMPAVHKGCGVKAGSTAGCRASALCGHEG